MNLAQYKDVELTPEQFLDICRQLQHDNCKLGRHEARELLNIFCRLCWKLEDNQETCYNIVADIFKNSSVTAKMFLVSGLMDRSIVYNNFVFLAYEIMSSLSDREREHIKIYPVYWTFDDAYSSITKEEYVYRQMHGLPCSHSTEDKFIRPSCLNDLKCFETMLKVLSMSKQKTYLYMGGWSD